MGDSEGQGESFLIEGPGFHSPRFWLCALRVKCSLQSQDLTNDAVDTADLLIIL
jgi:hypothetical protein